MNAKGKSGWNLGTAIAEVTTAKHTVDTRRHALDACGEYERQLVQAASVVNGEGRPIAEADMSMLTGSFILECTKAIQAFVREMRRNGLPASMEFQPVQRRENEVTNQRRARSFAGDHRPPYLLVTFAKDNPVLEDTLSYFLLTPSVGWLITVRIGGMRKKFALHATVGFPYPESFAGDLSAHIPQDADENKRYQAFPRSIVFFFGDPWNQQYTDSLEGIEPWLRHWLNEITPI